MSNIDLEKAKEYARNILRNAGRNHCDPHTGKTVLVSIYRGYEFRLSKGCAFSDWDVYVHKTDGSYAFGNWVRASHERLLDEILIETVLDNSLFERLNEAGNLEKTDYE